MATPKPKASNDRRDDNPIQIAAQLKRILKQIQTGCADVTIQGDVNVSLVVEERGPSLQAHFSVSIPPLPAPEPPAA